MANEAYIQGKIYYGYAKAAKYIGTSYAQYRASVPFDPISSPNFLRNILMSPNVSWDYMKANKFGNSLWQIIIDGRLTRVCDYLVGQQTFYITSQEPLLPIQGVECNDVVSVYRPTQPSGIGNIGYVADLPTTRTTIMTNMPVSRLLVSRSDELKLKLPVDAGFPRWIIYMPNIDGAEVHINDHVTNTMGEQFVVVNNEITEFGFRIIVKSYVTDG